MKYRLLIISLLLVLSFYFVACSPSINRNEKGLEISDSSIFNTPSIEFLSQEKGRVAILDESLELYFSNLQEKEIYAFTGQKPPTNNIDSARIFAKEKFSSAVITFSNDEKACITYVIDEISQVLNNHDLHIVANHPWKFIKTEDWLCGGFAYTRGDYIILSQRHLNALTEKWSEQMTETDQKELISSLGALLVHEQFHCLQRTHKKMFDKLYELWEFQKVNVQPEPFITINQLSNPDAPIPEWAFYKEGNYYWIRTLIKESATEPKMGKDFVDMVFLLGKNKDKFIVEKDINGKLITYDLSGFVDYQNKFPVKRGLDHPNEISAYMFSDYFISLFNKSIPFSDVEKEAKYNSEVFKSWVKKYLI